MTPAGMRAWARSERAEARGGGNGIGLLRREGRVRSSTFVIVKLNPKLRIALLREVGVFISWIVFVTEAETTEAGT